MAKYQINLTKHAAKQLDKLPINISELLYKSISKLSDHPRPNGCKKLKGRDGYRIRIGDYRIIYTIEDNILTIVIIDIGHRKDIYRN
ncbi:MAG: type II toxin-antitoxin system RelE/ParE family toxin [Cyclobacteriaceae bacterium]|nr:type II toxin-antitoxin system RelE/ParE family toxin [Cyclobacteriaceae bacterium]